MGICAFEQGIVIQIDNQPHRLLRKVSDTTWQIEEERTKRIKEATDEELRSMYLGGRLTFVTGAQSEHAGRTGRVHQDVPLELFEGAKIRRAYVHAILDRNSTAVKIAPVIFDVWAKLQQPPVPPHPVTVIRWKLAYLKSGRDIHSLVPRMARKGNRKSRYPKELVDIVNEAINSIYMTLERRTIQDVLDHAIIRVDRENRLRPEALHLSMPTRRFITRLIHQIPAFDRYCARHGRTAALNKFRSVQGHRTTTHPLQRCEIDHTALDEMVVDDETFLPLGRPHVTICIDDFTRCILGVFISFEPPSYLSVANCLRDAFLPKTTLQEKYPSLANPWVPHGVMRELVVDNGAEFHSVSFEQLCFSLGIEIHYAPRKTGWFKAKIERFLGSVNRGIAHTTPGTTFSNILERGDYDPSKHAVIRLSTLQEMVRVWINDYYHQKPHRALGMPPAVAWTTNIRPENVMVPDDPKRLEAILGRTATRRLSHKGIELDGLHYNSQDLADLRRRLGDLLTVEIRINDADLGNIFVLSPDKTQIFEAKCLSFDYANGLSRWQHKVCKNYAAKNLETYNPISWLKAKETIAQLIEQEFSHKRRKTAKRLARYQQGKAPGQTGQATNAVSAGEFRPPPAPENPVVQDTAAVANQARTPVPVRQDRRRLTPVVRNRDTSTVTGGEDD